MAWVEVAWVGVKGEWEFTEVVWMEVDNESVRSGSPGHNSTYVETSNEAMNSLLIFCESL